VPEPAAALSFGQLADLYERVRPGYPTDAVSAVLPPDAALPADAAVAVDVGAGTGKLTAALLARGLRVIAVEPDPQMRTVLAARLPGVEVRAGRGEQLPVPDQVADAVLYGQAWHWTEPAAAAAEAFRALVPGGVLGMLWNLHDDRGPQVRELDHLVGSNASYSDFLPPAELTGFGAGERLAFPWTLPLRREDLVDLTRTWSAVSTRPADEREAMLRSVRDLVERWPPLQPDGDLVAMPFVCGVHRYRRVS